MSTAASSSLPPSLPRTLELRARISSSTSHFVIGVDEAGRGPLAGPVVAAAFVILLPSSSAPPPSLEHGIADSKTVGESDRESLFGVISRCAACKQVAFETAIVDHARIDEINILQATFEAMSAAAQALVQKVRGLHGTKSSFSILIDGNKVCAFFHFWSVASRCHPTHHKVPPALASSQHSCTSVIKGDGIEFVIAAASICAKVTRDRIMRDIHQQFPAYNFEQHKGYGTAAHVAAIFKHGPCPYHRMTFAPLKNMAPRPSSSLAQSRSLKKFSSPKAASVSKAAAKQPHPSAISKRARADATATVDARRPASTAAPCTDNSERSLRLRRRIERNNSNIT